MITLCCSLTPSLSMCILPSNAIQLSKLVAFHLLNQEIHLSLDHIARPDSTPQSTQLFCWVDTGRVMWSRLKRISGMKWCCFDYRHSNRFDSTKAKLNIESKNQSFMIEKNWPRILEKCIRVANINILSNRNFTWHRNITSNRNILSSQTAKERRVKIPTPE